MPTLVASYLLTTTTNAASLVTPSFTPAVGEIIVVKGIVEGVSSSLAPSGGGLTYANRVTDATASHTWVGLWTTTTTSASSMAVTVTETGGLFSWSAVVERWSSAQLAGSPAVVDTRGAGAPSTTLTTVAAGSVVSWCNGDWAAVSPTGRTYDTTSATPTEDGLHDVSPGSYVAYYAYQSAASAGSQTLGLTAPTGQTWTLAGVEIQDLPAGPATDPNQYRPALPGGSPPLMGAVPFGMEFWQPPPWTADLPVSPPAPPAAAARSAPVQARGLPQQGGRVTRRAGTYGQAGLPVRALDGPVQARIPQPIRGGRVTRRAGTYGQFGPAVKALASAIAGKLRGLPFRGRAVGRSGVYGGLGPALRALAAPVRARWLPTRGGSTAGRAGTFTAVVLGAGPPVYPLGHPVQARRLPARGGSAESRIGVYGRTGPLAKPLSGPVQARTVNTRRGTVRSAGVSLGPCEYGYGTYGSGIYGTCIPLAPPAARSAPVQARGLPQQGGRVTRRAGTYGQAGLPVRALDGPVRAQPAPSRGGHITSRAGTLTAGAPQAGPPVYPLGHPVQARRQPLRGGHISRAAGAYSGTGAPVKAPDGPVRAQPAPSRGGHVTSRAGTFTAVVLGAGPPVYPLGHPVQARRLPARGGSVNRRSGVYGGTGAPVKPLQQPVGLSRRQPPPPTRGRAQSQRGPYRQTGPPVVRLRHPVRGQPATPVLTGRAAWRTGVYTAPIVVPFTVGTLTASTAAGVLTASTAAAAALTSDVERTGGPG